MYILSMYLCNYLSMCLSIYIVIVCDHEITHTSYTLLPRQVYIIYIYVYVIYI